MPKQFADNDEEILRVIDINGNWTGEYLTRKEASTIPGIYFNTANVWIINPKNQVLMEVRSKKKKFNPGKYGLPGGHVVKDSSPIDTAIEEVAEEIGYKLDKDDLIFLNVVEPAHPYRSFSHQHLHFADLDINDLVYQESEVEALEWVDFFQILDDINNGIDKYSLTKRNLETFDIIKKHLSKRKK